MSSSIQGALQDRRPLPWLAELGKLVGPEWVLTELPDLFAYSRDRAPVATFQIRNGNVPCSLPSAIVCPGSAEEVAAVIRFARRHRVPLIPYGAGSGVLGGALPLTRELVVDLKRLNRILDVNEFDGTVTVQAGLNGGQFEDELNRRGFTCGHLPQSLYMSTVGGWAACRGAGQNSTRFGKIEDIVLGLGAVLPDGERIDVRPVARRAVGPSLKDLLLGSEGTLGIITELTMRLWRLPEKREGLVVAFPSLQSGLEALRKTLQHELRPAVVRLYDEEESRQRTKGLSEFSAHPILAILEFSGPARLADVERDLAMDIAAREGGMRCGDAPYRHWLESRYMSYSPQWQARDHFMDTIEVTVAWSRIVPLYERVRRQMLELCDGMHFGAHWSHVYPEGACQYMTIRIPPMEETTALGLHARAWDIVQTACLDLGGSISHHHGAGLVRNRWIAAELGAGMGVLQGLKDHLDPDGLFTPGKLGLRMPPNARGIGPDGEIR